MVDSCLRCKFCNGAWRPRAAFQDRVLSFEDRIIYIDYVLYNRLINSIFVYVFICGGHHDSDSIAVLVMVSKAESIVFYRSCIMYTCQN